MRNFFILLACLYAVSANAQFGRFKKKSNDIGDVKYTTTTFSYNGEEVTVQRYKPIDLYAVMGGNNANKNNAITEIVKLQKELDYMQNYVKQKRELSGENASEYLDQIKKEDIDFDYTNYQNELNFYLKFKNPKTATYNKEANATYGAATGGLQAATLVMYKDIAGASAFNETMIAAAPGYHLSSADSISVPGHAEYTYSNSGGELMKFNYSTATMGANPDLKKKGAIVVKDQDIEGQFLSVIKIYNKLFGLNIAPEEAQQHGEYYGYFTFDGEMYNYVFSRSRKVAGNWVISVFKRG